MPFGQVFIHNRTPERAEGLAEYLMGFFPKSRVKAVLSIEGDMLKATVTPIDTPAGRSVAEFVEAMGGPGRLRGALAGVGNVKEVDGAMVVQDDYRITSVGLLLKEHWGGGRDPGTEEGPPAGEAVK